MLNLAKSWEKRQTDKKKSIFSPIQHCKNKITGDYEIGFSFLISRLYTEREKILLSLYSVNRLLYVYSENYKRTIIFANCIQKMHSSYFFYLTICIIEFELIWLLSF